MTTPATEVSLDSWLRVGQFLMYIIGIGAVLYRMGGMSKKFEMQGEQQAKQIDELEKAILELNKVVVAQAISTTRLDNQAVQMTQMQAEISALRRGEGFIVRER